MNSNLLAIIATIAGVLSLHAVEFAVNPMPLSVFADTEVSTNMVINKSHIDYSDLNFVFNGTPTNNFELAFGTDINTNGILEAEETETRFGWRSGKCFIENALSGDVFVCPISNSSLNFSVNMHLEVWCSSQQVCSMKVSGVNASAFVAMFSNVPPSWMWRRDWNLMRATRRGTDLPSDWIEYRAAHRGFIIRIK